MATDLQVRLMERVQEARVEVDGHHPARRSDLGAKPFGDGAATGPGLQALPAISHAQISHPTRGRRVKTLLEKSQTLAGFLPGIIKGIRAHFVLLQLRVRTTCQKGHWRTIER